MRDKAAVKISSYGTAKQPPMGALAEVFGRDGSREAAVEAILFEQGIHRQFPPPVLEQAARAPQAVCVATGLSYLRQFAPQVAAGLMEEGGARVVGFGREAFAYPDFARDILEKGEMTASKCCVTCGLCTRIMRAGGRPGCPVRDAEFYLPELRRVVK